LCWRLDFGAATLSRGQQPGEKRVEAPKAGEELRERVLKLRTEIDLVQVEFDVAREKYRDSLATAAEASNESNEGPAQFLQGLESFRKEARGDLELKAKTLSYCIRQTGMSISDLDQKLLEEWLAGGQKSKAAAERIKQLVAKQIADEANAERLTIDRQKSDFARVSRQLNEMKLNLAKLEKQYQHEGR
jgi:gas vesicle protein